VTQAITGSCLQAAEVFPLCHPSRDVAYRYTPSRHAGSANCLAQANERFPIFLFYTNAHVIRCFLFGENTSRAEDIARIRKKGLNIDVFHGISYLK
jgi:hypothetical protein